MKYSIYHLKTNEILNHFTLIFLGAILHTLISPNALSLACVAGGLLFWGRREKCFFHFSLRLDNCRPPVTQATLNLDLFPPPNV